MPRSTWSGSISFGMVSFPIQLYTAARDHDVKFNQHHRGCGGRIKQSKHCADCNAALDGPDIVKGYTPGRMAPVIFEDGELENLPLRSSKDVQIEAFLPAEGLNSLRVEKPYFCGPDVRAKVGQKAFALFRDALERNEQVAIAKIALRGGKEAICAIQPLGKALLLTTLRWPDEIVDVGEVEETIEDVAVSEAEAALADQLIAAHAADASILDTLQDDYLLALQQLIDSKLDPTADRPAPVALPKAEPVDLLAALQASIEAKKQEPAKDAPKKKGAKAA